MENQQIQTTLNHKLWQLDRDYKSSTNLLNYIDQSQNFYNGNQYPNANYKNMIRVTMNICKMAVETKASKICGTPIYLAFTADNNKTDCIALRQFDEYNCNKLGLETSNYQSACNGYCNGTEVTFIRWDDDDTAYKGIYKGGLVEEHIDLRNFAVANPYIQDIQNQQWVMFWEEVPVGSIKAMVEGKSKEDIEYKKNHLVREQNKEDEYMEKDKINQSLCRLYTRFFRVDGEVYFMCSTETVNIFEYPHPLSRKVSETKIKKIVDDYLADKEKEDNQEVIRDYNIDYEDLIIASTSKEKMDDEEYAKVKEKFSLYPFAIFRPFPQNRSFYGLSDIKNLIPIQKAVNFVLSMLVKCTENNAYNKIFVKKDTLQGQKITNEPSQIIVDYSAFTNGWGIKMAESQPMPNGLIEFVSSMIEMTRKVYGFSEVMDGTVSNQDMSGYMLQQMIKQSNNTLEQQQKIFWKFNEDKAAIRLMYYKHYVDKAKYTYEMDESEYEEQEEARKTWQNALANGYQSKAYPNARPEDFATPTHKTKVGYITNDELYGTSFDISIKAMQGLEDSKLIEQQMYDNMFLNGAMQNMDPENLDAYMTCSPNISERTKTALKLAIEKRKKSKIAQQEQQINELGSRLQQAINIIQQLEAQNGYKSEYTKNLEKEFTSKINQANTINTALMNDLTKYKDQASTNQGEVKSNNSRGISGSKVTTPSGTTQS